LRQSNSTCIMQIKSYMYYAAQNGHSKCVESLIK